MDQTAWDENGDSKTAAQIQIGSQSVDVSDLLCTLQNTISTFKESLNAKDKQIQMLNDGLSDMTSALAAVQQTAAVAQALHAGTIQQQIKL